MRNKTKLKKWKVLDSPLEWNKLVESLPAYWEVCVDSLQVQSCHMWKCPWARQWSPVCDGRTVWVHVQRKNPIGETFENNSHYVCIGTQGHQPSCCVAFKYMWVSQVIFSERQIGDVVFPSLAFSCYVCEPLLRPWHMIKTAVDFCTSTVYPITANCVQHIVFLSSLLSFCHSSSLSSLMSFLPSSVPFEPCSDIWDGDRSLLPPGHHYDSPVRPHLSGLQKQGLQTQTREEREEGNKVSGF